MTLLRISILGLSFLFILACDDFPRDDDDSGADSDSDTDSDSDSDTDTDTDTDADCQGNNVWLDESTGLCWQDPQPTSTMTWAQAVDYCEALVINEYDEWRLPKINELISLIRECTSSECAISDPTNLSQDLHNTAPCNDTCTINDGPGNSGCYWPGALDSECTMLATWSASIVEERANSHRWGIEFPSADLGYYLLDEELVIKCVK